MSDDNNPFETLGGQHSQLALMGLIPEFRTFGFPIMADLITEGRSGNTVIDTFEVTEKMAAVTAMQAQFTGDARSVIAPGRYARMLVGLGPDDPDYDAENRCILDDEDDGLHWVVMMSDTPHERAETARCVENFEGHVLIAGLGLGMLVHRLAEDPKIKSITVIEWSRDVINLVGPSLDDYQDDDRVVIVHADAREWEARYCIEIDAREMDRIFDSIFLDIWPNIGERMLEEIDMMREHYTPMLAPGGWMAAWVEHELRLTTAMMNMVLDSAQEHGTDVVKSLGWLNARFHAAQQEAAMSVIMGTDGGDNGQ